MQSLIQPHDSNQIYKIQIEVWGIASEQVDLILLYSCPRLVKPLPPRATRLIRLDFRCTEIVKYINCPLKGDYPTLLLYMG